MMKFPLQLRRTQDAAPAAAWLIPGADARGWIDEISRWNIPMADLRLHVLPRSMQDSRPLGVLVTGANSLQQNRAHRAQPYRVLADGLYLPADAELAPAISDSELRSALVWEIQILHPSAGLIGCRAEEGLRISDLLTPPPRIDVDWDCIARPILPARRLSSVEAEMPPTLENILEQGRDGIATETPGSLPPSADESKLDQILARMSRPGLNFVKWMASGNPRGPARHGWKNKLKQWAAKQLDRVDQTLLDARARELQRLQKLFDLNPDEALRFAIPFRDVGGRGRATPGWHLTDRSPQFNMGRLSGGQPSDSWSMPAETRQNLMARYRAAANRELNLKRYLRAAYVFGELLGDFSAAANALEQGRYFREAATLYRERLKNPAAAAKCLKQGGLLLEAVTIYEELGEYEEAGDLYALVNHEDDSIRCYRKAFKQAIGRDAHLQAARLLEAKLHAPDEALDLLLSQWPGSRSAAECLSAYFDLLERLNRHDQTLGHVKHLREQSLPDERVQPLAQILATLAVKYPAPAVRLVAADATRVVAGRRLAVVGGAEAKLLVAAVTRLSPEDRLLSRDGMRFLNPPVKPIKVAPSPAPNKPRLISEFRLLGNVTITSAVSTGDTFFAIGREDRERTVIFRGRWDGTVQKMYWPAGLNQERCVLEPGPFGRSLLLIPVGSRPQGSVNHMFSASEGFSEPCRVGVPAWLPDEVILGVGQDEGGVVWISHTTGSAQTILSSYSGDLGQLIGTRGPVEIASTGDGLWAGVTPVVARSGHLFLMSDPNVWHLNPVGAGEQVVRHIALPQSARRVASSPPFTRVRVAIGFDDGGVVLWDEGTQHQFGEGMSEPKIGFTRSGLLVAADRQEARVYRTDGFTLWRHASFPIHGIVPIAVCPAAKLNEIGFIAADGLVRVVEISPYRAP